MALQALATFASLTSAPSGGASSQLQLSATYGDSTHQFQPITRENALLLQTVEV